MSRSALVSAIAVLAALLGCGQQYVSPDTVGLTISTDATPSVQRVDRCLFVPVLLGSQVRSRYVVEDELRVIITITREELTLEYQGLDFYEPAHIATGDLDDLPEGGSWLPENTPDGYRAELTPRCTPDDDLD
jgi:hypothetical protein